VKGPNYWPVVFKKSDNWSSLRLVVVSSCNYPTVVLVTSIVKSFLEMFKQQLKMLGFLAGSSM